MTHWLLGFITGNPWVRKRNPHPPRGKPAPLQWVAGFPLSRVWVFAWELQDLAGSRTVKGCGFDHFNVLYITLYTVLYTHWDMTSQDMST
jgi:hypothetical protein